MREIRLRAYDKTNKKMIYFEPPRLDLEIPAIIFEPKEKVNSWGALELIQSTGLRDRNQVEIFEGDIIQQFLSKPPSINSVKYYRDGFRLSGYESFSLVAVIKVCQVLGNI